MIRYGYIAYQLQIIYMKIQSTLLANLSNLIEQFLASENDNLRLDSHVTGIALSVS